MKIAIVTAVTVVVVSGISLAAQQTNVTTQQNVQTNVGNQRVTQGTMTGASAGPNGASAEGIGTVYSNNANAKSVTSVNGELVKKLDSKSARVGDPVIVKTTQTTTAADGTVVPKGSLLIGYVTSVQTHRSGSENSSLGVSFDRAELHSGQTIAIHSTIQSLSPAVSAASSAMASGDDTMSGMSGGLRGAGGIGGSGAVRGGGLVGGASSAVGGSVHGVGSTVGAAGSSVASTTGSVANSAVGTTGQVASSTVATTGNGLRGTGQMGGQGAGSLAAQATGIPDVMLSGDASGATSGMLSAAKKNIHLDSGTQVVLGISSAVNR